MIKMIIKRLWKQRKLNRWLFMELTVVFVLMAALIDCLGMILKPVNEPLGYNLENVHAVELGFRFDYFKDSDTLTNPKTVRYNSVKEIVRRLEQYPDIENVTMFFGVNPYIDNRIEAFYVDSLKKFQTSIFYTDKNFFKVFDIKLLQGEIDERAMNDYPRTAIVATNLADSLFNLNKNQAIAKQNILGQTFYDKYNKGFSYKIIGVVPAVKLSPVSSYVLCAYLPLEEWMVDSNTPYIAVRVKESSKNHFDRAFYDDLKKELEIGPYYLDQVRSYTQMAEDSFERRTLNRFFYIGYLFVIFLVFNVFLGVIGSFWFRTYSRRGEIGLRKALGAPSSRILSELILEGGILLLAASVPALIICGNLIYFELPVTDFCEFTIWRGLAALLSPYLLLFVMVVLGIWYPARRAMRVVPADALHAE